MNIYKFNRILSEAATSVRTAIATMAVCSLIYGSVVLIFGQALSPDRANGSLIYNDHGETVGSSLIAQGFSQDKYLWPRPSAVGYNASSAGGSNLSTTNRELRSRAQSIMERIHVSEDQLMPADLITASGSGLDPHITLEAALIQSPRISEARGVEAETVKNLLHDFSRRPGVTISSAPLVNVLEINLALDRIGKGYGQ